MRNSTTHLLSNFGGNTRIGDFRNRGRFTLIDGFHYLQLHISATTCLLVIRSGSIFIR